MRTTASLAFLALLVAARPPENPPTAFTDVTRDSGVAEGVARHYRDFPKWWLSGLTLVDLDGDGALDLHLGSHSGPTSPAAMLRGDGKGRFSYVDPQFSVARGPRHAEPLPYPGGEIRLPWDINEDGKVDLLCSWHDGGGALYLNGSKPDAWTFRRGDALDPFSRAVAIGDLDGDGQVDYLTGHERSDKSSVLLGREKGAFEKGASIAGLLESGAIPADLDGDGKLDLLLSQRGYNPARRKVLRNEGNLKFSPWDAGLDENAGSIHGVGDLNGDGAPDLICLEGPKVVLYFNDGKGRFTAKADAVQGQERARNKPHYANWGGAIVTDLDNDGVPDILINGRCFFWVLRGTGGGTFAYANDTWGLPDAATSAVDEGLCFGDVDGDGRLDLVTCARGPEGIEKGVALFHNDLPLRHWIRVRLLGKDGNRSAAGARIRIRPAGDAGKILWDEQISIWGRQSFHSYYAAAVTERHFGLGDREAVDVSVVFHPSGKRIEKKAVPSDGTVLIEEDK